MARVPARGLPPGVRILDHTADTGIEVDGATLEECFARAAAGMFACFVEGGGAGERVLDVTVDGASNEELLVAWLEDLLSRAEVAGLLLHTFEVGRVGAPGLTGRAWGRRLRPDDEPTGSVVKAVTRHGLAVEHTGGRWRATVLFDV